MEKSMEKFLLSGLELLQHMEHPIFIKDNFSLYAKTIAESAAKLLPETSCAEWAPHADSFSLCTWNLSKKHGKKFVKEGYIFFVSDIEGFKSGYIGKYCGAFIQTKIHLPQTNDLNYFLESLRQSIPYVVTQQIH